MYNRIYYIVVLYSRNLSAKFISPKYGFGLASAGKLICGFLCIWRHLFSESQDIFNLIFGKHAHLSPSWMLNISEFQLSSFFVHRKKFTKNLKYFFFPQHANELNIPNILKYASNRINSFIYPNKFYYIMESIIIL